MLVGPPLRGGGFLGCPPETNTPQQKEPAPPTNHTCQKCGKNHNERKSNEADDECDEPVHEHANEPINKKAYIPKKIIQ